MFRTLERLLPMMPCTHCLQDIAKLSATWTRLSPSFSCMRSLQAELGTSLSSCAIF